MVYGGVHIQPTININTTHSSQTHAAINNCFNPNNHIAVTRTHLAAPPPESQSSSFYLRAQQTPVMASGGSSNSRGSASSGGSSSNSGGGSSSSGGGGSKRPPSPPGGGRPNAPDPDKRYNKAPDTLPGYPKAVPRKGLTPDGIGGYRTRWVLPDGKILEWDKRHGDLEVYSRGGRKHLGSYDPVTGNQIKPPNGRTIKKFVN